jgi:hypothetical protein
VEFGNAFKSGMRYYPALVSLKQDASCRGDFMITDPTGQARSYTTGNKTALSETWNHLAFVYENTDLIIYLNGVLSTRGHDESLINSSSVNTTRLFNYFGYNERYKNAGSFWYVPFMLDEVRLYNKALSQDQVQRDMSTASGIASGLC